MSYPNNNAYVSNKSAVQRPFYVLVEQTLISNAPNCLDLNQGDIFLVTKYNKVGYWWGVSVYDLNTQGWFPSTFVQPYTGEVPPEASELFSIITRNSHTDSMESPSPPVAKEEETNDEKKVVNIVSNSDNTQFSEYQSTMLIVNRGRTVHALDQHATSQIEQAYEKEPEDAFDYESWAASKLEERQFMSDSKHKRRKT